MMLLAVLSLCEFPMQSNAPISIRAQEMSWNRDLILKGKVVLEQDFVLNADEIHLRFASPKGPIAQIEAIGSPSLSLPSQTPSGHPRTLRCKGSLTLDTATRTVRTQTPIAYSDGNLSIEAASASLSYSIVEGHFQPSFLTCSDQIRIHSQPEGGRESFAIADKLSYDIGARTAILSGGSPRRVLFSQPASSLALSADEAKLLFEPETNQCSLQGMGDVHFSLDIQEQNLLETVFSKYL